MHKKREHDNYSLFNHMLAALRDTSLPFLTNLTDQQIVDYLAKLDQTALAHLLLPFIGFRKWAKEAFVQDLIKVVRDETLPFAAIAENYTDEQIAAFLNSLNPDAITKFVSYLMQFFESKLKQRKINLYIEDANSLMHNLSLQEEKGLNTSLLKSFMEKMIIPQYKDAKSFPIMPYHSDLLTSFIKTSNNWHIKTHYSDTELIKSYSKSEILNSSPNPLQSVIHKIPHQHISDLYNLAISKNNHSVLEILKWTPKSLIDFDKLFLKPAGVAPSVATRVAEAVGVDDLVPLRLVAGPRPKVVETHFLEALIRSILRGVQYQVVIDGKLNEVILIDPHDPDHRLNLTALLHCAQLSHVDFTSEEVDDYVSFLERDYPSHLNPVKVHLQTNAPLPNHFRRLHPGLLYALAIYTKHVKISILLSWLWSSIKSAVKVKSVLNTILSYIKNTAEIQPCGLVNLLIA